MWLVQRLPAGAKKPVLCLASLLTIGFCLLTAYYGMQIVLTQLDTNQVTAALGIPMAVPYLAIPVGLVISALEEGIHLFEKLSA